MSNNRKSDDKKIVAESVETTEVHHIFRNHKVIIAVPDFSPWAEAIFVETEREQEEPTEDADINFKITDVPSPAPSVQAEVNFSLVDGEGSITVPSRHTGQLLDGCIALGCAVSAGITTKWVLETPNDSLQDWMILIVVMMQYIGIGVLALHAMRRRQR